MFTIRCALLSYFFLALGVPAFAGASEGEIFTLWPLIDYRTSPQVEYSSLHLLGPLVKIEKKGDETEFALRPLFFKAQDESSGIDFSEYLYPVGTGQSNPGDERFKALGLVHGEGQQDQNGPSRYFTLFPLIFYEDKAQGPDCFAFFPFGGRILNRFGRDRIEFALFPLYARTWKKGTETTNALWPIFASIQGEKESGIKFWPLVGASEKEGVYRKRFLLWPFFFAEDLKLDTDNPVTKRAFFPFIINDESPQVSSTTALWPLFQRLEDRQKGYRQYDFPWPLFRVSDGSDRKVRRFLPLFSHEEIADREKIWAFWPFYKFEGLETDIISRKRHRVLFFLYSDLDERVLDGSRPEVRRISLWPLFTFNKKGGVSHFHTLSLFEPFFPGSGGIERNWAPLWRLYQCKWDAQGNEVSSFLWNLYWKERRGEDLAYEVFPLVSYRKEGEENRELTLFKGLFKYRRNSGQTRVNLLYLPWSFPFSTSGSSPSSSQGVGG